MLPKYYFLPKLSKLDPKMKIICGIVFLLLTLIILFIISGNILSTQNDLVGNYDGSFTVSSSENPQVSVNAWYNPKDQKYYLFLPPSFNLEDVNIDFGKYDYATIDGTPIHGGETTNILKNNTEYRAKIGYYDLTLVILQSTNLPSIFINTASGGLDDIHSDKSFKESGELTLINNEEVVLDNIKLKYIKGRGNTSWSKSGDKKPYNIKFRDDIDVLGMGAAKKWVLVANTFDSTLAKNLLALNIAENLHLEYIPKCQPIDLWINSEYRGNYLICSKIEVGENRINIADMDELNNIANPGIKPEESEQLNGSDSQKGYYYSFKKWVDLPNSPADITGDYLLELDYCYFSSKEASSFSTAHDQCVTLKNPEYASYSEISYMQNFYQEVEEALYSQDGYNSLHKHWLEYFGPENIAKTYLLEEFMMDWDAGLASQFFIKKSGEEHLIAIAPWDFDNSMGETIFDDKLSSFYAVDSFWANINTYHDSTRSPGIFNLLWRHQDFKDLVKQTWQENILNFDVDAKIDDLIHNISRSATLNNIRWGASDSETANIESRYIQDTSTYLHDFVKNRRNFLSENL